MRPDDIAAILAISCVLGGPFLCGLLWIVCHYSAKVTRHLVDTHVKLKMISLGYSGSDIEAVLGISLNDVHRGTLNQRLKPSAPIVTAQTIKAPQ